MAGFLQVERIDSYTFTLVLLRQLRTRVGELVWTNAYLIPWLKQLICHKLRIDVDMVRTAKVNDAVAPLYLLQAGMMSRNLRMTPCRHCIHQTANTHQEVG